jgi:hypothetical protein
MKMKVLPTAGQIQAARVEFLKMEIKLANPLKEMVRLEKPATSRKATGMLTNNGSRMKTA